MKAAFSTPICATNPPLPVPPFLLLQNLSSKQNAPTGNMLSKTDDAKKASSVVEGLEFDSDHKLPSILCSLS